VAYLAGDVGSVSVQDACDQLCRRSLGDATISNEGVRRNRRLLIEMLVIRRMLERFA